MKIKKGYVATGDGQIHYRFLDEGEGPYLIFFHMIASSSQCYEKVMELLGNKYRMFALDLPGFGESFSPRQDPTITYYVSILLEALTNLNVQEFHVFGHHTGAAVGIEMAVTAPDRVRSLMMKGPVWLTEEETRSLKDMLANPVPVESDGSHLSKIWNHVVGLDPDHPAMLCHREAVDTLRAMKHMHEAFVGVFSQDYDAMFARAACPMLLICPDNDLLKFSFDRICTSCPNATSINLPECGIYALDNHPDLIAEKVRAFLNNL